MTKVKDGYWRVISNEGIGSDNYLLKAGGGYVGVGNSSDYVPISNRTVNINLNADLLDGYHKSDLVGSLTKGSWNPRGTNLAMDWYYNGGDMSISESGGQISISIDGFFYQNEGQYKVLDTNNYSSTLDNRYVKKAGDTMTGQLYINLDQDVEADQNGSLVIGSKTGYNIGIDANEIMARNNSAAATLYLQNAGGSLDVRSSTNYFSGSVGIGTSSPSMKLHVSGDGIYLNSSATCGINMYSTHSESSISYKSSNGTRTVIGTYSNRSFFWNEGIGEHISILSSNGYMGIGTTSPIYKLHVVGDVYANGGWLRSSGDTGWYNESWGGGFYMTDSTYVRVYNGKYLYTTYQYYNVANEDYTIDHVYASNDRFIRPMAFSTFTTKLLSQFGITTDTRRSKNSSNSDIESVTGYVLKNKSFIDIWGFAPTATYRTTKDRPAPYGIGFTDGSDSGGIMPVGDSNALKEIRFYGANSGPTHFTFGRMTWESNSYDADYSNHFDLYTDIDGTNGNFWTAGNISTDSHLYLKYYLYMPNSSGSWISTIDRSGNSPIFGYGQGQSGYHVYYTGRTVSINAGTGWSSTGNGIYIDASNNVGIGTNSPRVKLDVGGYDSSVIIGNTNGSPGVSTARKLRLGLATVGHTGSQYWAFCVDDTTSNSYLQIGYTSSDKDISIRHDGYMGLGISAPTYRLDMSGSMRLQSGVMHIWPGGSNYYDEGIRIHPASNGWITIALCGTDNTGDTGVTGNSWNIHKNPSNNFYINRGSSDGHTGYELCNVGGNWGIGTVSPSQKLHVSGGLEIIDYNSRYLILGPQNSSHAHYETNADVSHWFNKRVDVNGAIWRYGSDYGIDSDGRFYAHTIYANRSASSTAGGVSLYYTSDPMSEYGIAFRGTGSYGKYQGIQSDWATYFTMNNDTARGWMFRRGGNNVLAIDGYGSLNRIVTRRLRLPGAYQLATGWYRLARISGLDGYFNFNAWFTGGWNWGAPSQVMANVACYHTSPVLTQLAGVNNGVITKMRLYNISGGTYYLDVWNNYTPSGGTISDQYVLITGSVNIEEMYEPTSTTSDSGGSELSFENITGHSVTRENAYWANIQVQTSSNSGTAPTFNTCYTSNWFRSTGSTGWYNESYGGGIWMYDSSWIRTYGSKNFYVEGGNFAVSGNAGIGRTSMSYRLDVEGDSYTRGWARADSGFYCEGTGVHFTHQGSVGEIDMTSNNEFLWGSSGSTLYFNYRGVSRGTTVTNYVWNAGSSSSWANHNMGNIWLNGSGVYLRIGPQNSSHAHYETNAGTSHWFNKRVDVNGDIYLYGTSVRMQMSNGYVYSSGFYHNSYGSSEWLNRTDGGALYWPTAYDNRYYRQYTTENISMGSLWCGYGTGMSTQLGPTSSWWHIFSSGWSDNTYWISQIAVPTADGWGSNHMMYRTYHGSDYGWRTVLDNTNYTSYTDGRYLQYEGWWSSGSGQNVDDAHGIIFAYSDHGAPGSWGTMLTLECNRGNGYRHQIHGRCNANELYHRYRNGDNGSWSGWNKILDSGNSYVSGSWGWINGTRIDWTEGSDRAAHLLINGATWYSNWYWSGQGGQPTWLWGSNDGTNMYVWNPSNFSVNYANSAGNADTVDNEHSSAFAHRQTWNNMIHSGNEYTWIGPGYSGGVWINYRTSSGSLDGNITEYIFGNGKGGSLASISSGWFSGSCSNSDTVDGYHASGLLTAASLGASGNSTTLSVTVGGTTKTGSVTVPYASTVGISTTSSNSDYNVVFRSGNYLYADSGINFNPNTNVLSVGSIRYGYSGGSSSAGSTNWGDYGVLYCSSSGACTFNLPNSTYAKTGMVIYCVKKENGNATFNASGCTLNWMHRNDGIYNASGSLTISNGAHNYKNIYICIYTAGGWFIASTDYTL